MPENIRVLIADDHPVVRRGLRAVMSTQGDITVVGEAEDGDEAVRLALELDPDVTLIDLLMPRMGGIEAIAKIRATKPDARFLVLTSYDAEDHVLEAIQAGALGFHLKDSPPEQLLRGIREVNRGQTSLHPAAAKVVVSHLVSGKPRENPLSRLSKREAEVLAMVARGMSNAEIALTLALKEHTVAKHVSRILEKLEVTNRTQAALLAANGGPGISQET